MTHPVSWTASCPACGSDCRWTSVPHEIRRDMFVPAYTFDCACRDLHAHIVAMREAAK